jgi:integrase
VILEGREESTVRQYRQHAAHINERIGGMKLAALTAPSINTNFKNDLLRTMSQVMARKVLSSLKSLLRHAQANGKVAQNVALAVKIKPDKRGEKKLEIGVDIPTTDEIKQILAAATAASRPLLLVAIFTGLRSSELRGLRWTDVDFKHGKLHVRQRADRYGQIGNPKSKASHRTVPLAPDVVQTLREWKVQCPNSGAHGLVFPAVNGDGVALHNNVVRSFIAAVRAAGLTDKSGRLKYTGSHALRHFYASWCINPLSAAASVCRLKSCNSCLGIPQSA